MTLVAYLTVSTKTYLENTSTENVKELIRCLQEGYEIQSAVGDGMGAVHYVLIKDGVKEP